MEIFLFAPYGLGAKFEFSLHAQPRTEKLPRGAKSNAFLKQMYRFWGQALISLCSAQRENMEFRLAGQNDRHFLNPFSGFENR